MVFDRTDFKERLETARRETENILNGKFKKEYEALRGLSAEQI